MIVIWDIWDANFKIEEQQQMINEIARRCRLKGRNCQCQDCPMATGCEVEEQLQHIEEEITYASPY